MSNENVKFHKIVTKEILSFKATWFTSFTESGSQPKAESPEKKLDFRNHNRSFDAEH